MVSVLSRGVSRNVAVTRAACTSHRSVAKAADTGVVTACSAAARLRRAGCYSSSVRLTSQRPSGLAANMSSKGRSLHASSTCGSCSAARDAAAGVATPCSPAARLRRTGRQVVFIPLTSQRPNGPAVSVYSEELQLHASHVSGSRSAAREPASRHLSLSQRGFQAIASVDQPAAQRCSGQRSARIPHCVFPAEVGVPPKRRRRRCEHSTWLRFEAIPSV